MDQLRAKLSVPFTCLKYQSYLLKNMEMHIWQEKKGKRCLILPPLHFPVLIHPSQGFPTCWVQKYNSPQFSFGTAPIHCCGPVGPMKKWSVGETMTQLSPSLMWTISVTQMHFFLRDIRMILYATACQLYIHLVLGDFLVLFHAKLVV